MVRVYSEEDLLRMVRENEKTEKRNTAVVPEAPVYTVISRKPKRVHFTTKNIRRAEVYKRLFNADEIVVGYDRLISATEIENYERDVRSYRKSAFKN